MADALNLWLDGHTDVWPAPTAQSRRVAGVMAGRIEARSPALAGFLADHAGTARP